MKKNKKRDFKDIIIIALLLVSIIAITTNVWMLIKKDDALNSISHGNIKVEEASQKNPDSISIPGYESIILKANSLEQTIAFNNPSQNCCYFVITLCLEDGKILWESDYIEPGEVSDPIKLNQELEAGTYPNTILKYSCYSIEDRSQLNGAETKLTLMVK